MPHSRTYHLLLVDDNPADLSLLEIAFRQCPGVHLQTHRLEHPRDIL